MAPFQPNTTTSRGGGFVEGDSAQYSWMVPQDPAGLFRAIGGRMKAIARLRRFLRRLNGGAGGTHTDHALLGNEPTLHVPWLYDWTRQPFRTQATVRRALGLYSTAPDGYPGNDDLGTLSSWYVFGALGLYPEVPGVGLLAIGSPLFRRASVDAAAAPPSENHGQRSRPQPTSMDCGSTAIPPTGPGPPGARCAAAAELDFRLSPHPNRRWGSSAAGAPPSFGPGRAMPRDACTP